MAARTPRELRKFGLTVGGAFLVLGTVSWWRGHVVPPRVLWTLGALLLAPGLLAPALLAPVERAWMRLAEALGWVNTRLILGVLFYVVVTPLGWVLRRFRDPLDRRLDGAGGSAWVRRPPAVADPAAYRHQF
ncbi:MAG TPA: SxtJ family membrane protein [Candidatus Binatia bacterium]|nr:SxtJ family membrane protein [Candidatus Binatia bacterium]